MKKVGLVIVFLIVLYYVYKRIPVTEVGCDVPLTYHERQVFRMSSSVPSSEVVVVGHDDIVEDVYGVLRLWEREDRSGLYDPPKGILLYGPPGTGKTTLVKHICKEHQIAHWLRITPDMVENKYQGESFKLMRAVFTLAKKLQPCLIFFDEIDGIMAARNDIDQSHTNTMKTMFLNGMDEIGSSKVLVVGATNRPECLDKALMRRMELKFEMGYPSSSVKRQFVNRMTTDLPSFDEETKSFVCEHFESLHDIQVFLKYYIRSEQTDVYHVLDKFNRQLKY
jgi:SpoVK/Ycf46/Vps4 family AAA+-type ATPase